jgi:uncharacterized membrane protein YhaH (DUF805 family)
VSGPTKDLANALLYRIVGGMLALGLVGAVVTGLASGDWARPGSWLLQSLAILGAVLLLASFAAVLAKRFGGGGKRGFHAHVGLASLGLALVLVHWGFTIIQFPTLLLMLLAALIALGIWSRSPGAVRMADTFGRKHAAFAAPEPAVRERLRSIIAEKRQVLATLAPNANEGTFSLQPRHWLTSPFRALAYQRLCSAESQLVGADAVLSQTHRHWRLAHRLLAWGFVGGLALHVILVTFFAGYVAGDGAIYWWHIADWNF